MKKKAIEWHETKGRYRTTYAPSVWWADTAMGQAWMWFRPDTVDIDLGVGDWGPTLAFYGTLIVRPDSVVANYYEWVEEDADVARSRAEVWFDKILTGTIQPGAWVSIRYVGRELIVGQRVWVNPKRRWGVIREEYDQFWTVELEGQYRQPVDIRSYRKDELENGYWLLAGYGSGEWQTDDKGVIHSFFEERQRVCEHSTMVIPDMVTYRRLFPWQVELPHK